MHCRDKLRVLLRHKNAGEIRLPNAENDKKERHKTVPLADSKFHVNGYPRKLTIYKSKASPYFWVRYYVDGKIIKRSTKTESKREAVAFAKMFYDEINLRRAQGQLLTQKNTFTSVAYAMLRSMEAQVARHQNLTSNRCKR